MSDFAVQLLGFTSDCQGKHGDSVLIIVIIFEHVDGEKNAEHEEDIQDHQQVYAVVQEW